MDISAIKVGSIISRTYILWEVLEVVDRGYVVAEYNPGTRHHHGH